MTPCALPSDVPVRLAIIAELSGWSEAILRKEVMQGRMAGQKVRGFYVASWEAYKEWIDADRKSTRLNSSHRT